MYGHLGGDLVGGGLKGNLRLHEGLELGGGGLGTEDLDLGDVGLQAGDVESEGLLGDVAAAVVSRDAKGAGLAGAQLDGLELLVGETLTEANAEVVALGSKTNNGADGAGDGAGEEEGSLGRALGAADLLLGGLVKEGGDVTLLRRVGVPVLVEVVVRDTVVTGDHLELPR